MWMHPVLLCTWLLFIWDTRRPLGENVLATLLCNTVSAGSYQKSISSSVGLGKNGWIHRARSTVSSRWTLSLSYYSARSTLFFTKGGGGMRGHGAARLSRLGQIKDSAGLTPLPYYSSGQLRCQQTSFLTLHYPRSEVEVSFCLWWFHDWLGIVPLFLDRAKRSTRRMYSGVLSRVNVQTNLC